MQCGDGTYGMSATVDTSQYGLVEGLYVKLYGQKSGMTTGNVISTSYSETYSGKAMTNLIKSICVAINGDSGAALVYQRYVGSASTVPSVLGLQSASKLLGTGSWYYGSYSLQSRID